MKKKIVYMGTPHYAKEILQTILEDEDMDVTLILTQPDRPVGRKRVLTAPVVKELASAYSIEVLQPQRLSDDGIIEKIKEHKPDFIVVAAFGQLLPREILDIAPCINLHASLLPQYRGASPVQQSLLHGDRYSGVTAMLMEEGLDSGPILGYQYYEIPSDMSLGGLMERLSQDACSLTLDILKKFESIEPIPQTKAVASYCKKIAKSDGEIRFLDAIELYNRYRAFEGWPGVFTEKGLKIVEMRIVDSINPHKEAEILEIGDSSIRVGCLRGSVSISQLQPASKRVMDAKSYLVGRGLKVGDSLV